MWFSSVIFLCVSLAAAQDNRNCECIAYFYCNTTQVVNDFSSAVTWKFGESSRRYFQNSCVCQCENVQEVCCDLGSPEPTESPDSTRPTQPTSNGFICGKRGSEPPLAPGQIALWKITSFDGGDVDTYFGEFPWMVAIMKVNRSGQTFLCGGSIIYPNMILTTAHSISGVDARDLRVKAGVWNTSDDDEVSKHQDRLVIRKVQHSGFDNAMIANDFALLVLNESLTITDNVAPVCLPSPQRPVNMTSCLAIGWGADNFDNKTTQSTLKKIYLPMIDFSSCQSQLQKAKGFGPRFRLHNSFICAGDDRGDTCVGDGGGPLMCATVEDPNRFVQVGITSWGVGCAQGYPGVYSSVEAGADWIERQAEAFPSTVIDQSYSRSPL